MSWTELPVLSVLILLPVVGAISLAVLPARSESLHRGLALFWTLFAFGYSLLVWSLFDPTAASFQLEEDFLWIKSLGIRYHLGVDGLSMLLVILTTFLAPLVVLSAWRAVNKRVKEYMIHMLLIEASIIGALVALDLFLFYIFWEFMLIPMYFLIGVWGSKRRLYATLKFVLFTMVGSLLMLVGIIYLYVVYAKTNGSGTTDLPSLLTLASTLSLKEQMLLFAAFALAFAIKVPMWPFHTWLPDAHTEAPTGGSVILAGVLLKMGTYGFLRFAIPLFPLATYQLLPVIATLAVIGILYGALVCMVQPDMKRLIAYSSISHLGFVMLGIAGMSTRAVEGAIYQMLNHGISTGALFFLVGVIYERRHTRLIADFGGLAKVMPAYAALFSITALSSIGLPGLNGFVGEFLIMFGTFTSPNLPYAKVFATVAALGVIFAAVYLLWMYKRVFFGRIKHKENEALADLSLREWGYLLPLVVMMFVMGIFPNLFLRGMEPSVDRLIVNYRKAVVSAGFVKDKSSALASNEANVPNSTPKFILLKGTPDKPEVIKPVISIPTGSGRKSVPLDKVNLRLPKRRAVPALKNRHLKTLPTNPARATNGGKP